MSQFNINFEVPKHNIKKLNTVFDLDTPETDIYKLIILSDSTGLNKDTLDKVDSSITSKESDNYTQPTIEMILEETGTGYNIKTGIIEVEADGVVSIQAMLIFKEDSGDILTCCFVNVNVIDSFSISPQSNLWVFGEGG